MRRRPVAVTTPPSANVETSVEVVWHVLNTNDVTRATANHHDLFGWEDSNRLELRAGVAFQQVAWHPGGPSAGAFADTAPRPGVHPHWRVFFEDDALHPAMAATSAAGR